MIAGLNQISAARQAQLAQLTASDPALNAFVSANAGSGKTKVLVDRVIRLLLSGAKPERILCLTYTKAAASEMQARLFKRLGAWSVSDDAALAEDLAVLAPEQGRAGAEALRAARALFARALETPGGLKVQTIHAFCERLLRRFPLEAGVPAGFEVLDDADAARLGDRARARLGAAALAGGPLAEAFEVLAARVNDDAADGFLAWASERRGALRDWFASQGGREGATARLAERLGLSVGDRAADVKSQAWNETPLDELRAAAKALRLGSPQDGKLADALEAAVSAASPEAAFDAYCAAVFTKEGAGDLRASYATKPTLERAPFLARLFGGKADGYGVEPTRMEAARDRVRAAAALETTDAGFALAEAFVAAYEDEKSARGSLDFADLVGAARRMLGTSQAADWVLYKLDGGVDHVLVDEAQDTAPEQWDIINALTEEFFAGAGARETVRTAFAVGDEKQSIYSFQGADPARFLEETRKLERLSREGGAPFKAPRMGVSFRSAPAILEAVDAVFASQAAREGIVPGGEPPDLDVVAHQAARANMRGCVTLWPLLEAEELDRSEHDWSAPLDDAAPDHPRERLARGVAQHIADWLAQGASVSEETLDAEGARKRVTRPMRAGDVMILVRKRSALFHALIRALKRAGVPVAGADRMTLSAELAVEDLVGAMRVGALPEDDLALAELLKSPFFHPIGAPHPPIDDAALFDLAHGRTGCLIDALRQSDDPRFHQARACIDDLVDRAAVEGPYQFLAGFLDRAAGEDETYAARLFARLGVEAEDPVKELLSRALAHERHGAPSLVRFAHETAAQAAEVKRQTGGDRDEVRVMTVHASKGLEAPVVILPDTLPSRGRSATGPLADEDAGFVWSPTKREDPALAASARARREAAERAEDFRLLYVAMTRACDRLVVCGAAGKRAPAALGWYGHIRTGLEALGAEPCDTPAGEGRVWGSLPPASGAETPQRRDRLAPPAWLSVSAPQGDRPARMRAPSAGLVGGPGASPALSPLAAGGPDRFRRGVLIHKLLETLPDLPPARRKAAARAYLAAEGLDRKTAAAYAKEVFAVMAHPDIAPLFGPGSKAEAAIAGAAPGLPEGFVVNGRVDRLSVRDDAVIVADFKTNRPPPERVEDADPAYLLQMAVYRALLAELYPDRAIIAALIWTDAPRADVLPHSLLDERLRDCLMEDDIVHT